MQLRRQKFSEMLGYEFPRKLSGTGSSREYSLSGIVLCLAGKSSGVTSIGISWIDGLQKRRRLPHDTGRTKTPARGKATFLDHAGGLPDRNSGGSLYDGSGCSGKLPAYGRGIFAGDRSGKRAARGFGRSL